MPTTLGTKYVCFMCQCKFYDLNRREPICPRCGANQNEQAKPKAPAPRSRAAERVREEPVPVPVEEEEKEEEAAMGGILGQPEILEEKDEGEGEDDEDVDES